MTVTNYIWDVENDSYLVETDEADTTKAVYTNEPVEFGNLVSQRRDTDTSYYLFDASGSTRELTDDTETVTDTNLYDAWGVNVDNSGITENPFRWIGQVGYCCDKETDDYYIKDRSYSPRIARWESLDPIGQYESLNGYLYSANTPINSIDPSGQAESRYTVNPGCAQNPKNVWGYRTAYGPDVVHDCGAYEYKIDLWIRHGIGRVLTGGWVLPHGVFVQHVKFVFDVKTCEGEAVTLPPPLPPNNELYEAFGKYSSSFFGESVSAGDLWVHRPTDKCTKGRIVATGRMKFLARYKLIPSDWNKLKTSMSPFISRATPPPYQGSDTGGLCNGVTNWSKEKFALVRRLTVEWDCCECGLCNDKTPPKPTKLKLEEWNEP